MSRGNISAQYAVPEGYVVEFLAHSGTRAYLYDFASGLAIASGADPRNFSARPYDPSNSALTELGEAAEEVVEGAAEVLPFIA